MIYTLTLNPSIDYHVWLSSFEEGLIHSVNKEHKVAGGKGINVSKVLKLLGTESTALGFVGGFTGKFIKNEIESLGISHEFIQIPGDSRINVKIKAETETDLSGVSPQVSKEAVDQLLFRLTQLNKDDTLVLAGSVPTTVSKDIYQIIMDRVSTNQVRVFLDTKGEALVKCLSKRPFLIKPNHHELGEIFNVAIESPSEAITYGRKVLALGAQNVIVSLAGKGAVFVSEVVSYLAKIPERKPINSIGAGDSMVAGFLYSYLKDERLESAFRFAVAAGSATALSEGFCTADRISELMPDVVIEQL